MSSEIGPNSEYSPVYRSDLELEVWRRGDGGMLINCQRMEVGLLYLPLIVD